MRDLLPATAKVLSYSLMRNICRPAAILLVVCTVASSLAGDLVTSEYTKTTKGVVVAQSKPKAEMAWSSIRYQGRGGYEVIVHDEDSRSWVDLSYGGRKIDLREETFRLAPGHFPNKANDVVEWRGVAGRNGLVPYAAIYRLSGYNEETGKSQTRLIVIELKGGNSRVVGYAEGKNEDADAKKLADRFKP